MAANLGEPCEHLAVVDSQRHPDTEAAVDLVHDLDELELAELAAAADHIHVALVEFAVTALLGAVGAPHGLNLEALERQGYLVLVLDHVARERHREVIAQTLFANLRRQRLREVGAGEGVA